MVAQRKRKCNHDDTETTLVLQGDERKVGTLLAIRQATLIETCKICNEEQNYYVVGGVLFNA